MAWFRVPAWCPSRTKVNREPSFSAEEGEPAIGGIKLGNWEAALSNTQLEYLRRIVARGGGHFNLLQ